MSHVLNVFGGFTGSGASQAAAWWYWDVLKGASALA
jgi:hypothetical protein